jgi:hypothetical protein
MDIYIVASKYYVEAIRKTKRARIYMKDAESEQLQGIEKYSLGLRILDDLVDTYDRMRVSNKAKSRYPGVKTASSVELYLEDGRILRISKKGLELGTPNAHTTQ